MTLITQAHCARLMGITRQAVNQAIARKAIPYEEPRPGDKRISLEWVNARMQAKPEVPLAAASELPGDIGEGPVRDV